MGGRGRVKMGGMGRWCGWQGEVKMGGMGR